MSHTARVILCGAVGVIAFDAVASFSSHQLGFAYTSAVVGSWLLYAIVGFAAARSSGLWAGVISGAAMGLVDATAGWAVSWAIGPGQVTGVTPVVFVIVVITVVVSGASCGAVGALGARLFKSAPK